RAGITNYLLEHKPRILLIDELDKMDARDYPALLSAMESGYVAELKYRRQRSVMTPLRVFASANRIHRLPRELQSRFYKIHLKEYSRREFVEVAVKVLTLREGVDKDLAKYIAERLSRRTRDVREAVRLARLVGTKEEVKTVLEVVSRYGGM
ncbi:MAG: AAA family ATPase, partial [Candidatus Bathyarchaeia archaeon]